MKLADVDFDKWDGVLCAKLRGEVDMSNADELRADLSLMTPNDALGLVLDLSEVEYLDSAGIHLIHRLREDLHARGQRLELVIPAESLINDTLRLAGLDWGEETVESVDAAREALLPGNSACNQ